MSFQPLRVGPAPYSVPYSPSAPTALHVQYLLPGKCGTHRCISPEVQTLQQEWGVFCAFRALCKRRPRALSKMPASLLLPWRVSWKSLGEARDSWAQSHSGNKALPLLVTFVLGTLVTQLSSPSNWDKGKELAVPQSRPGTQPGPVVNCCVPGLTIHSSHAVCESGA